MFAPSVDTRVHWFRVIVQLKEKGHSLYSVSTLTEIPKSTLVGYKQGAEPKYHDGDRLLRVWAHVVGKELSDAPRISPYSYRA